MTNTTVTCDFKQVNLSSDRVASFHCIRSTNVSSEELLAAEVTQNWHFPKVQCPSAVFSDTSSPLASSKNASRVIVPSVDALWRKRWDEQD